ncbi:hypothetical protein [Mammaliicoccus fleurettii]|uniref:hypothetical protein n=1 Tax=Mammaliicoccus fleurettii TaxID=150056 RepID=UPI002DB82EC7|nr:hypothetical protein [Mammaliicoccus fleurettii]MEB7723414.1 hypothetical protein [Mammaliicoccus fleurettii]
MNFKVGDRVHVTKLDGGKVDFYATLSDFNSRNDITDLVNCTNRSLEGVGVYLPNDEDFGPDKEDYYTLATDEEDSEPVEVQYIESENKVELDNHYIVEVKKGLYIQDVSSNYYYFQFTKNIKNARIYEHKESINRHAELVDGRIVSIKRHIEV